MFYDLNVPYAPNDSEIPNTLAFLSELGYTTIALSQSVSGKLPADLSPPPLPANPPKSLTLLTRITVNVSDPSQNQRLTPLAQQYSLIALRPLNEKCLTLACNSLDCDIISLDLSSRLPFHFKFKTLAAAIARGVRLEICYGPGVTGSGAEARRNLIGNAASLIRATRGRGIIISSEAKRALGVRAPFDVVNLACVWGLTQERGKEALCDEARKVVALAGMKRRSWRGIVDVVYGGEKPVKEVRETKDKNGNKNKNRGRKDEGDRSGVKRKADTETESNAESQAPLSKRELKRRAKRAKLQGSGSNDNSTASPMPDAG
ncbi:ribonuclease P/MRP protein subunit RPP1 [Blastomyces gilchristii SLH14081]|uniref:Ribonuclease P/MRP protein subunit RPP1 n=1 Tax=Blastomyces gilchristii (strain SLH14081) TaxID=559298 RepID=A0A179UME8_BLAGS|nr:ribonuclease P/MRP protein subunit RPP1 [Blastomyces gilchristii SLH14081]EQL36741.1 ribonuclease P/MRP protein subunit RPP1 [Blastomyces dermatitidis ATCC 26199]OAT08317.1 ribonuclease P/MRP protein subunit RPP1 [Blastomyces gilchristii SLH14081]